MIDRIEDYIKTNAMYLLITVVVVAVAIFAGYVGELRQAHGGFDSLYVTNVLLVTIIMILVFQD